VFANRKVSEVTSKRSIMFSFAPSLASDVSNVKRFQVIPLSTRQGDKAQLLKSGVFLRLAGGGYVQTSNCGFRPYRKI
jgi:hypothetical protein